MSYESSAEPIKVGYLMDFRLPEFYPQEMRDDFRQPFELVFDEGWKQGVMAPGTRISLGKWTRRGWMGAGYLVARTLDPDGKTSDLVDRFGEE